MRCVSCLKKVPVVKGLAPESRCLKCQREEAQQTVDACVQLGWEARVISRRGRVRVSVHTELGEVTVHDRDDLPFLQVDVAA